MAIWQYDIEVVPLKKLQEKNISVPSRITKGQYENTFWWYNIFEPVNLGNDLNRILPRSISWCDEIRQWGNEDSTCIQLISENNKLVEFIIRLDLRYLSDDLLQSLLQVIFKYNYVLLINDLKFINPEFEDLVAEIVRSETYKIIFKN